MSDVEFLSKSTGRPLPWDIANDCPVYRQFEEGWYVRLLRRGQAPRIKVGDEWLSLVPVPGRDGYQIPGEEMRSSIKSQSGSTVDAPLESYAGRLCLWSGADPPVPLTPEIQVEAGSLARGEFDEIVRRLRQLAAFHYSPFQGRESREAHGTSDQTKPVRADDPDRVLLDAAKHLRDLSHCVLKNWPLIRASAAKETRLTARTVDVFRYHGPNSARMIQQAASRPAARRLEVLMPQESHRTVENRFLAHVLAEILRRSEPVSGRLQDRATQLAGVWSVQNNPESPQNGRGGRYSEFMTSWKIGRERADTLIQEMWKVAEEIDTAAGRVAPLRTEAFLQECLAEPALPERLSDKLARSEAYGPVFRAYHRYRRGAGALFIPLNVGLETALINAYASLCPVWNLYELWVLVELFDLLVTRFGFKPEGSDHPLRHVEVARGEVLRHRLAGREFRLRHEPTDRRGRPVPGREVSIRLWYDTDRNVSACQHGKRCFRQDVCHPLHCFQKIMTTAPGHSRADWSRLRPDLFMEISACSGNADASEGADVRTERFAVDAKYRRYAKQREATPADRAAYGAETVFEADLLGTAKMKYRDALECQAAFIVHSDPDRRFRFWGGEPMGKTPAGEKGRFYPAHHFGTVFGTPRDITGLEMLVHCLLTYHMQIEDVCWPCRRIVDQVEDQAGRWRKSVGHCYQCPSCRRFWVRTWCQQHGHYLVKMGAQTFHSQKDGVPGIYACPQCGDETNFGDAKNYGVGSHGEGNGGFGGRY